MPANEEAGTRYRSAIGHTIAATRASRGWSLRAFAERSGISLAYLSELEHGQKEPSGAMLEQIASAFDLPFADFLQLIANRAKQLDPPPEIPTDGLDHAEIEQVAEFAAWLRWRKAQ